MTTNWVTEQQLQAIATRINKTLGTPETPYIKVDGKFVAQIDCYHLSHAYGGVALHQMMSEGGGVHDIFGWHMPKRELADRMLAFLKGIETIKEQS